MLKMMIIEGIKPHFSMHVFHEWKTNAKMWNTFPTLSMDFEMGLQDGVSCFEIFEESIEHIHLLPHA